MIKFHFELDLNELDVEGDLVLPGHLTIGEFKENFQASISYWTRSDYLSQWDCALSRLLKGKSNSAFVTNMYNPNSANFIFWWVMYLIEDKVHIQNHALFLCDLEQRFDENNIYKFIPERETISEEGESISEWVVDIDTLRS